MWFTIRICYRSNRRHGTDRPRRILLGLNWSIRPRSIWEMEDPGTKRLDNFRPFREHPTMKNVRWNWCLLTAPKSCPSVRLQDNTASIVYTLYEEYINIIYFFCVGRKKFAKQNNNVVRKKNIYHWELCWYDPVRRRPRAPRWSVLWKELDRSSWWRFRPRASWNPILTL